MSANIEMKSSESEAPLRGKEVKASIIIKSGHDKQEIPVPHNNRRPGI